MGWEKRGAKLYYYRKTRRADGGVASIYIGSGLDALAAEAEDALGSDDVVTDAEESAPHETLSEAACAMIEALTDAALLASGHHQHKRQWRRKREAKR
jgi:hypothetical protein